VCGFLAPVVTFVLDMVFCLGVKVSDTFLFFARPKDTFVVIDEEEVVLVIVVGSMDEALYCLVVNFLGGK